MKIKTTNLNKIINMFQILGTIAYIIGCVWINFNGRQWFSFDIYSDTLVAKLMAENGSFFPENWVFGNQYYIIATPVLTTIIYLFCHNSVLSLSIASTIMMFAILLCFIWCLRPFLKKSHVIIGLFCISGAVILGNSASSYANGLQYFYTMASFYACYIFVIFFTLGIIFRVRENYKISKIAFISAVLLSFALGMQSLRQTLVLYLPLIALLLFLYVLRHGEHKSTFFSIILLISNLSGYFIMKFSPVKSTPIISEIALVKNIEEFTDNFISTSNAFLSITGLRFIQNSWKWIPLFIISLFFCSVVIISLKKIITNKDLSVISCLILFCWISLLAVYAVGVLLFRVRAIYFFIWYILVCFSFIYLIGQTKRHSTQIIVSILLLFCGSLNFIFNFVPDILSYLNANSYYESTTDELISEGIDCIYYDIHTTPVLAAYSNDKIISGTVFLDPSGKSGGLMYPVNYLLPIDVFRNAENFNSYIVFSNWTFDYLKANATEEYMEELFDHLTYVKTVRYGDEYLIFYRFPVSLLNTDYSL